MYDWLVDSWWYGLWMLMGFATGKIVLIVWDWFFPAKETT